MQTLFPSFIYFICKTKKMSELGKITQLKCFYLDMDGTAITSVTIPHCDS